MITIAVVVRLFGYDAVMYSPSSMTTGHKTNEVGTAQR